MEINLLPWREQARQVRSKLRWGLLVVMLLALSIIWWGYFTVSAKPAPPVLAATNQATPELLNISYIGLVQQGSRTWGLIRLADGSTYDVQVGKTIPNTDAQVIKITATELIIQRHQQPPKIINMQTKG
jgi:hypothetical protein